MKADLIGNTPSIGDLRDGDLEWSIDFRNFYATLLGQCLNSSTADVLGVRFDPLPVLDA